MTLQYPYYAMAFAMAMVIMSGLSLYVWQRRRSPGGFYFALLMAAAAEWALCSAMEISVTGEPTKILFAKLSYLGSSTVAPLWLLFALDYGQYTRWVRSRWGMLIWVIPSVVVLLAFTNEWHGLVWPAITPLADDSGAILLYQHGPAVWVNVASSYVLMLAGSVILLVAALQSFKRFHLIAVTIVLGAIAPWAANILYMAALNPVPGLDITPFAFTITGVLVTWAIFGQHMLELVPVARDMLLQVMADGAIVLDSDGRVVEMNASARRILGIPEGAAVGDGQSFPEKWPELAGLCRGGENAAGEIVLPGQKGDTWLEERVSGLSDTRGRLAGRLVVLRDISKRKRAEEDLKQANEVLRTEVAERTRAEEALNASLREKEVLLKEIHHRVKNNLQIISSLLSLQTTNPGHEGANLAFRDSQDRIRSMALIHEKLYRSRDVAHIDFAEYVESLASGLFRSYAPGPGIALAVDVTGVSLDIDMAIPCGLIINELVSNSLKYAFKDARDGEIRVSLSRDGGAYTLKVSDNGAGIGPEIDFKNTTSLGLQLVNTLVEQLEGTIQLDASGGTSFKITFAEIK